MMIRRTNKNTPFTPSFVRVLRFHILITSPNVVAPAPKYWNQGGMGSFRGVHGEHVEREP